MSTPEILRLTPGCVGKFTGTTSKGHSVAVVLKGNEKSTVVVTEDSEGIALVRLVG
jgi:K+/H+ antiporter YhaU regulatory subunit KhtT